MTIGRQVVGTVSLVWATLAFLPLVILAHSEYRGIAEGWVHASLDPGDELFSWTRNRLLAWGALYAAGSLLLLIARRRDADGAILGHFAATRQAGVLVATLVALLLVLVTFADPADLVLCALLAMVAFLGLWTACRTGPALTTVVGRVLMVAIALGLLSALGEAVLRIPAIVERTGGSLEARDVLWNRTDFQKVTAGNFLRLRSRHVGRPKETGVSRILALGDSFTAGDWVDNIDETWPYVLEAELQRSQRKVEVLNVGTGGANTETEERLLRDLGWSFAPDVLVLQYTLNDTQASERTPMPLVPLLHGGLRRKSHLYSLLNARFQSLVASWSGAENLAPYFEEDYGGWQRSRAALAEIASQARARRVPMLIVLYPWLSGPIDDQAYPHLGIHDKIAAVAASLGLPFLDARPLLAAADGDGRAFWARDFDAHPNARAHRIVGEAVARKLSELGCLPD